MFKVNDNDTRTAPNVALPLLLNLNRCFSHEGELSAISLFTKTIHTYFIPPKNTRKPKFSGDFRGYKFGKLARNLLRKMSEQHPTIF